MPFYDFKCDKCEKIVEEFFKIADEKKIECCGIQMTQVILSAPGLRDPGGTGQKWTNDGGSSAEGRYTKIGDLIRCHFVFTTGSLSGTAQFQIKAFPFAAGSNDKHRGAVCMGYTNASNWPIVGGLIGNNGTTAYVLIGSGNIAENGEIGTSKTITGTITYSTN